MAVVLAAVMLPVASAGPAQAATTVVETVLSVPGTPEPDGTPVSLDATLLTTDPGTPRPAIVLAHGLGGTKDDSLELGRSLAKDGYAVIAYTARGFGASGGLIHLDSPDYEGRDAVAVVDEAASRPEISKQGDDPVIGFAGASYGGAISLIAAGLDPRIDAIVPAFTYHNLAQALVPQYRVSGEPTSLADVTPTGGSGVFKQGWTAVLFAGTAGQGGGSGSGGSGDDEAAYCGRFAADFCAEYQRAAESGRASDALLGLLDEAAPARLLSKITAPTLLLQGEDDTLFGLDQADANLRGLPADTPAAMDWVPGGHDGDVSVDTQLPRVTAWFDQYLKGEAPATPTPGFRVTVPETALVGSGDDTRPAPVLSLPTYPGRTAAPVLRRFDLSGDAQQLVNPPGAEPGALTNLPGTGGVLGQAARLAGYPLAVRGGQSATFTSAVATDPVDLVGSGRVSLRVTSSTTSAVLFVSGWDLGPPTEEPVAGVTAGSPSSAVLPGLAVAPVRLDGLTPGRATTVEVALPAVAHQIPVGHRFQVVVSSTDQAYAGPRTAATYTVALAEPTLVLPELGDATVVGRGGLDVPLPLVLVVAAIVAAALVGAFVLWRRRHDAVVRDDLVDVPLVVDGLVKTYKDGLKAVDGVSFSATAGQVVGLLGPNGAGKTTTMRMLVGLIRPDAGAIYVHGQPIHAGADVLGSVGAFIEGPGFLPHLSGLANLEAYWQATGRDVEEARMDEVLEIAGLGDAVHRRVRGYSQGMRQRLGIAQAMLGFPSLLLLDEPTNGLDPPQIKTMRQVLTDYAAAGRTVVVSSHLLSEVEQTCDHVVMMNKGTVVLTGATRALTVSADVTLVGLTEGTDLAAATTALADLDASVTTEDGRLRVAGPVSRAAVVAALVDAGFGVESVDGRRHLEEVFMSLMGDHVAGGERGR